MKPYLHAELSMKRWGGKPEDYLPIHDFFDSSKAHVADMRHRMILHNTFGIFLAERLFGTYITNSDGKKIQVRDVGERHVLEDLGTIPSLDRCLRSMTLETWMGGPVTRKIKKISLID